LKTEGFRGSFAATTAGVIALMGSGTDDTGKCSGKRWSAPSGSNRLETPF
jgi:hypothetical protein